MSSALHAKDVGNKLFKEGKLAESIKFYKEAEKLDPQSPVYPSNLSAALYELGDYAGCMEAILRSWSLGPTTDMGLKLSTRLAKTLSQGVQTDTINPSVIEQNDPAIKELEKASKPDNVDSVQAWKMWRNIRRGLDYRTDLVREAKIRFSKLPIYKPMLEPEMLYFAFGIEPVVSLATGFGPENEESLNIRALSKEQLPSLAFMLAGIGDGRHGFATIIGLGKQYEKLSASQKKAFKVHITINDIHFGIVARNFMFYLLLEQLTDNLDPTTRVEIEATLCYMYAGWVVPEYVHERFVKLCQDAEDKLSEDPPRLPAWLHVDSDTIEPIKKVIHFWSTDNTKKTADVLDHLTYGSASDHITSLLNSGSDLMGVRGAMQAQREDAARSLRNIPDSALRELGNMMRWRQTTIPDLRRKLKQDREEVIDVMLMARFDKNIELGLFPEAEWFRRTTTFVPPAELIDRHPGFDYYYKSFGLRGDKPDIDDVKYKKLKTSIAKTWKPNITIFDKPSARCVDMSLDAFGCVQEIAKFSAKHRIKDTNNQRKMTSPAFSILSAFIDTAASAVKMIKDNLQMEFLGGEINTELTRLSFGLDHRPANFPRVYTRMWLSNIPDYRHGTLSTATFALPLLQDDVDGSGITSNCQFNSPTWQSDEEFCYNYILLLPRDLDRYLGIRTLNPNAVQDALTLAIRPRPRPLASLASREELHSWLSRLLLALIWPGTAQVRPNTIKLPNNLVAFVKLLYELRTIGYPSHWLSDFLNAVLNGTLQVDHTIHRGKTPRPVSDLYNRVAAHRVRLDPWHAELETILASTKDCLPFALQLPDGFVSSADAIGVFKAVPAPTILFKSPLINLPTNDNVMAFLFYRPAEAGLQTNRDLHHFLPELPSVIDGKKATPPPGTFHVFTTIEFGDLSAPLVRWKMSKSLAAKMRRERWMFVLWRMDLHVPVTEPCPASAWQTVDAPI